MQPIIGMISDKSTSKYGRRRPFMVGGTVAVAVCLLILGWAMDIVKWAVPGEGADVEERVCSDRHENIGGVRLGS